MPISDISCKAEQNAQESEEFFHSVKQLIHYVRIGRKDSTKQGENKTNRFFFARRADKNQPIACETTVFIKTRHNNRYFFCNPDNNCVAL